MPAESFDQWTRTTDYPAMRGLDRVASFATSRTERTGAPEFLVARAANGHGRRLCPVAVNAGSMATATTSAPA